MTKKKTYLWPKQCINVAWAVFIVVGIRNPPPPKKGGVMFIVVINKKNPLRGPSLSFKLSLLK